MNRSRLHVAVLLVVASFGTAIMPARAACAQTPAAPPASAIPGTLRFTVSNRQRLVTVRDQDGKWLFARLIDTPRVVTEMLLDQKKRTLGVTLKEENGKRLARLPDIPLPPGGSFNFDGGWNASGGGEASEKPGQHSFTLTITPPAPGSEMEETAATPASAERTKLVTLLDSSDTLVNVVVDSGENLTRLERVGNRLAMTQYEDGKKTGEMSVELDADKGTVRLVKDGKEIGFVAKGAVEDQPFVLRDARGEIKVLPAVTRDGKSYTPIQVGDRTLLFPTEGGLNVRLTEGEVIVARPATGAVPVAKQ